jgi:hypothetical protein
MLILGARVRRGMSWPISFRLGEARGSEDLSPTSQVEFGLRSSVLLFRLQRVPNLICGIDALRGQKRPTG